MAPDSQDGCGMKPLTGIQAAVSPQKWIDVSIYRWPARASAWRSRSYLPAQVRGRLRGSTPCSHGTIVIDFVSVEGFDAASISDIGSPPPSRGGLVKTPGSRQGNPRLPTPRLISISGGAAATVSRVESALRLFGRRDPRRPERTSVVAHYPERQLRPQRLMVPIVLESFHLILPSRLYGSDEAESGRNASSR